MFEYDDIIHNCFMVIKIFLFEMKYSVIKV